LPDTTAELTHTSEETAATSQSELLQFLAFWHTTKSTAR